MRGGLVSHDDGRSPVSLRLSGVDPGVHLVFPRDTLVGEGGGILPHSQSLHLVSLVDVGEGKGREGRGERW